MNTNLNKFIKIENFNSFSIKEHKINKILLLNSTHNLVCSYGEDCQIEIFSLKFEKSENKNNYNSLQKILDPHYYSIEYLLETKINSNNKNYLLICSDMIHVFYLYNNDTKSILLQSINEFNYRFIYQVIELRNGGLISSSNEYKISVFSNLLIKNHEYIDSINDENKKEIYELERDKINKKNEIILYLLELFPDKFSYCYKIDDGEFTRFLNNNEEEEEDDLEKEEDNKDLNNISDDYIYIKFLDNEYNIITNIEIDEVNKDIYNMFQYSENIIVFINSSYLSLIDINYYEIVSKIRTTRINFAYFFTNLMLNKFFINYLILKINNFENSFSSENENNTDNEEEEEEENINNGNFNENINNLSEEENLMEKDEEKNEINFYDLKNITHGIKKIQLIDNNFKEIEFNEHLNEEDLLEMSIANDNINNNIYYLSLFNGDSKISFTKFKIYNEN